MLTPAICGTTTMLVVLTKWYTKTVRIQVLICPDRHKYFTECVWILSFSSVWSDPLTHDYSWISVWSSLVKCQQANSTVMYTNNQLNKDGAAAKLFVCRLHCDVFLVLSFLRECDRSEDKHLRDEFWASVRYRHGEYYSLLFPPRCNEHCESSNLSRLLVFIQLHL